MKKLLAALALIAGLTSAAGVALAETRVALVIGNNDYATLPDLNNASRDARDIAAKLKELGLLRIEGKGYVLQEGDVLEFRFNV